jgi:hypothetical protein
MIIQDKDIDYIYLLSKIELSYCNNKINLCKRSDNLLKDLKSFVKYVNSTSNTSINNFNLLLEELNQISYQESIKNRIKVLDLLNIVKMFLIFLY